MIWLWHISLAIGLFYLVNWIGRHSTGYGYLPLSVFVRPDVAPAFNFLLRVLSPSVFIVIVSVAAYSAGLDGLTKSIWVVAPMSAICRLLYNSVLGRARLLNYTALAVQFLVGTALSYWVYVNLVVPRAPLFPDAKSIGNELWLIISLFIYAVLNGMSFSSSASVRRKKRYLLIQTNKFKREYGHLIDGQMSAPLLELLVYAVLVYENFNRPPFFRVFERLTPFRGVRSTGVMQVRASAPLSDAESVERGVALINSCYREVVSEHSRSRRQDFLLRRVIAKYNRDDEYVDEVAELMREIAMQVLTEYRVDYEREFYEVGLDEDPRV